MQEATEASNLAVSTGGSRPSLKVEEAGLKLQGLKVHVYVDVWVKKAAMNVCQYECWWWSIS